jgi:hypothetical protein
MSGETAQPDRGPVHGGAYTYLTADDAAALDAAGQLTIGRPVVAVNGTAVGECPECAPEG